MPDILIRDVPDEALAEIDRQAKAQGISRSDFLRRHLKSGFRSPRPAVTRADYERSMAAMADLGDSEVMAGAWQ